MSTATKDYRSSPSAELKSLQTQRARCLEKLNELSESQRNLSREISEARKNLEAVEKQIDQLSKAGIVVTEHAMLRYLERVRGIDLEQVKAEILTPKIEEQINTLQSGTFPNPAGFKLRVKKRTVVTILAESESDE